MKSTVKSPTQKRKHREKEQRRKNIIEAAGSLFGTQGFENTTMDQIALQAELSKGTLYNFFKSKNDIYIALGILSIRKLNDLFELAVKNSEPGLIQLKALGDSYIRFTEDFPEYAKVLHDLASKESIISTKDKDMLTRSEREYIDEKVKNTKIFRLAVKNGIHNGFIRDDLDPMLIVMTLQTVLTGLINELSHQVVLLKELGINPRDITSLVFFMISKGLEKK